MDPCSRMKEQLIVVRRNHAVVLFFQFKRMRGKRREKKKCGKINQLSENIERSMRRSRRLRIVHFTFI